MVAASPWAANLECDFVIEALYSTSEPASECLESESSTERATVFRIPSARLPVNYSDNSPVTNKDVVQSELAVRKDRVRLAFAMLGCFSRFRLDKTVPDLSVELVECSM